MSLTHLRRRSHKVDWKLSPEITEDGARIIILSQETDWSDLMARAEARSDARILSTSLNCPIKILSANGDELDIIGAIGPKGLK